MRNEKKERKEKEKGKEGRKTVLIVLNMKSYVVCECMHDWEFFLFSSLNQERICYCCYSFFVSRISIIHLFSPSLLFLLCCSLLILVLIEERRESSVLYIMINLRERNIGNRKEDGEIAIERNREIERKLIIERRVERERERGA